MKIDRLQEAKNYYSDKMSGLSYGQISEKYNTTKGTVKGLINQYIKHLSGEVNNESFDNNTIYEEGNDFINIICASERMMTKEDIIIQFNIDLEKWEIERFKIKTSEGYRKDRKVKWKVQNGKVLEGDVDDTGKMLVVPLYHLEIRLARKKPELNKEFIDKILSGICEKNISPIQINKEKINSSLSMIIPIADLHLGLYSDKNTSGDNYNIDIAEKRFYQVIKNASSKIEKNTIKEICFVIGNDFLNSDNLSGTTTKGTQQDNEKLWYDLHDKAIELITKAIITFNQYSKVKVINVPSNHDNQSMYSILKVVQAYFRNEISIDLSPFPRKYYKFGKTLIGFTHDIPVNKCLEVMTVEAKEYWAYCDKFIWMMAHFHRQMEYEKIGLLEIYRLPTISSNSRWASSQGYTQPEKKSQCFLVDDKHGIVETYNIYV